MMIGSKQHSQNSLPTVRDNEDELEHEDNNQDYQQQQQASPQQQPQPIQLQWTARALYNFEGQPEFSELSFSAGDVLTVLKVGLAEGWSLAEKDGVRGLVPETYITHIRDFPASPDSQNGTNGGHSQFISNMSTISIPQQPTTPTTPGPPSSNNNTINRNSVFGKRQLNRFSWFVTTGAEEFLLTGGAGTANSTSAAAAAAAAARLQQQQQQQLKFDGGHHPDAYSSIRSTMSTNSSHYQPSHYSSTGTMSSLSGGTTRLGGTVTSRIAEDEDEDEVTESDKHYIESGPSWQEKAPIFKVRVHDPETRRKMVGMQEYTLFQVTSSFTQGVSVTVERRYSQFEWLYERLLNKFGALVFPPLPEKQYAGRFSEEFIEKRRRGLERFLSRLVRHPVLRYSDLLTHFLSCSDESEWKRSEKKFEQDDKIVGTQFFQHVYHPEFNVGDDGEVDLVDRFNAHATGTEKLMPAVVDASAAFKDGMMESKFRYKRLGLSLLKLVSTMEKRDGVVENQTLNDELAWCWRENCKECLKLTKAIQSTAETMQLMANLHDTHHQEGCLPWQETLREHSTPATSYAPLVDMHTGTHKKLIEIYAATSSSDDPTYSSSSPPPPGTLNEIDSEIVKSRCDTVFNIALAEMDRCHDERVQDFKTGTSQFLDAQIAFHEKMLVHLKQAKAGFEAPYYDQLGNSPRFRSSYEKEMDDVLAQSSHHSQMKPSRPTSVASVASVSGMVGGVVDGVGFMGGLLKTKTRNTAGRSAMFGDWSSWSSRKD